jgi:hypothetical protein
MEDYLQGDKGQVIPSKELRQEESNSNTSIDDSEEYLPVMMQVMMKK